MSEEHCIINFFTWVKTTTQYTPDTHSEMMLGASIHSSTQYHHGCIYIRSCIYLSPDSEALWPVTMAEHPGEEVTKPTINTWLASTWFSFSTSHRSKAYSRDRCSAKRSSEMKCYTEIRYRQGPPLDDKTWQRMWNWHWRKQQMVLIRIIPWFLAYQ